MTASIGTKNARPHLIRAGLAALVCALAVGVGVSMPMGRLFDPTPQRVIGWASAVVALLAGVVAVRSTARAIKAGTEPRLGVGRAKPLALIVSITGYLIVALCILSILEVKMGNLLLGGALTGVALGIAAQQTLGNFFAGLLLVVVRPFAVGDTVVLKSGLGEYEGRVTDMGLFYMKMVTKRGLVMLPNAAVIASAVGPGARTEDPPAEAEEEEDPRKAADPSRNAAEPA